MQYWNLLPVVHVLFSMTLIKICNLCPDNGSVPNDHANQSWKTHIVIWACWVLRNKIAVTRWASFHSIQCYLKILSRKFCCGLHMLNSWNTHIHYRSNRVLCLSTNCSLLPGICSGAIFRGTWVGSKAAGSLTLGCRSTTAWIMSLAKS